MENFIKFDKMSGTIYGQVSSYFLDKNNLPDDIIEIPFEIYSSYIATPNKYKVNTETKTIEEI